MNAALSQKLNKVLETRLDQPELLSASRYLSTFYTKNTLPARRNLRGDIERRTVAINHQFLDALEKVHLQLQSVETSVVEMRTCCDNMSERLKTTRAVAGKIISKAQKLQEESERLKRREEVASTFINMFQLSPDETNALYAAQLDDHFFASLRRVHQIHNDCKLLLRTQHRAGIEIMDLMTIHEQAAYNRLYRWIQAQCRALDFDTPEINSMLKLAIAALRDRPVLFNSCLEEIENTRCKALVQSFLDALTKGGKNGLPRPIELHAHDSVRYIGDILAWIHQAVASEGELISSLLGKPDPKQAQQALVVVSRTTSSSPAFSIEEDLHRVLNKCFEGICRPFKVRFDQVLELQQANEVFVVYRLVNLVDFYYRTISKIMIDSHSPLSRCLYDSKNDALKKFYDLLKEQADRLQRAPPPPPSDLSPPTALQETLAQLVEVMATFNLSLVPVEQREAEFKPVLIAVIDPLLQMCSLSATSLSTNSADVAVYMINCLSLMQASLVPYDFASPRVERLASEIDAHLDTLVDEEVTALLANCALAEKVKAVQEIEAAEEENNNNKPVNKVRLSELPGLDERSLSEGIRRFESLLFELSSFSLKESEKIINTRLKSTARSGVVRNLGIAYSTIYEAVMDPKNGYKDPTEIVRYPPSQIQALLST